MILNKKEKDKIKFALVGAPNVGKSTYFNRISWKISNVGNVDRLTTSLMFGNLKKNKDVQLIDLPGIYNFSSITNDENITLDYLMKNKLEVINIVNVNSLERDLHLTLDLLEAKVIKSLVINMIDETNKFNINEFKIFNKLKIPISLISAKKNLNVNDSLSKFLNKNNLKNKFVISYSNKIEKFLAECEEKINFKCSLDKRFCFIQYLLGNLYFISYFEEAGLLKKIKLIYNKYNFSQKDINNINETRQEIIKDIISEAFIKKNNFEKNSLFIKSQKIDKFFLNPYLSFIFFILVVLGIFYLTFGEYAGGFIQASFQTYIFDALQSLTLEHMVLTNHSFWDTSLVVDGLLNGFFIVLSFLPWIFILTFLVSILEQIGYFSRAAISMDYLFRKFGLSGRSIINLIVGVGCNVPAILMARNSQSYKERMISILIIPLVSCSARIIVFGWVANFLLPPNLTWLLISGLIFFSAIVCLFLAYIFSSTIFRNKSTFFMTEVPIWRSLDIKTLVKKIIFEMWYFLKRVLIVITIANLIIWFLLSTGPTLGMLNFYYSNGSLLVTPDNIEFSWLFYISNALRYIFIPVGFGNDWRLVSTFFASAPAKEIAVTNLSLLFSDGLGFQNYINTTANSWSIMLSFLLMINFSLPCIATFITLKKETSWKFVCLQIAMSFGLSYTISCIFFSISSFFNIISNLNFSLTYSGVAINIVISCLVILFCYILFIVIKNIYYKNNNQIILVNKISSQLTYYLLPICFSLFFISSILMSI